MSEAPIRVGHPDTNPRPEDTCGCCEGVSLSTAERILNRPKLSSIAYRVGDHPSFKASMLSRLASATLPALARLGTRDDDDFTIALIDAWATVLDVLTFYQERHAQEAYIGTATSRLSINEIAQLIGYRLHPGSAAETDMVFLMEDPPGAEPDVEKLTIAQGTRVQSIPGPDEEAQVFETLADLDARVAWNAMVPRQERPIAVDAWPALGTWVAGQATGLSPGDAVLILHPDRIAGASDLWAFRRLKTVEPDATLDRTWIGWETALPTLSPAGETAPVHKVFALRKQTALFGHNAPLPAVLHRNTRAKFGFTGGTVPSNSPSPILGDEANVGDWDYTFNQSDNRIMLDGQQKEFVRDSWAVLTAQGVDATRLYKVKSTLSDAEARYGISGRITAFEPDQTGWTSTYTGRYRTVSVYGGSEELTLAETPDRLFLIGNRIELGSKIPDLAPDRSVILEGRRAQVVVNTAELEFARLTGGTTTLTRGTRLTALGMIFIPVPPFYSLWLVTDPDGDALWIWTPALNFRVVPADDDAPKIRLLNAIKDVDQTDPLRSTLVLKTGFLSPLDRATTVVHGNVTRASHGEAASEIVGAGDPTKPFQSFSLKQSPVTHLLASTANGVASTLSVRIDGVEWTEVPDLYQRGATARVFATTLADTGETTIRFGDGISGARPPAGRDNIEAEYRAGLGKAGNVRAGQLSLAIDRPLGLKEVINPFAAADGADAETEDAARRNAPIYTLTLDRVVSVTDYRDFALGYPGIARADARWIWEGEARRITVTVAGDDGTTVPKNGKLAQALKQAYRDYGDPLVQFDLLSYTPVAFRIALKVAVEAGYDSEDVLSAVETALRAAYAFENRDFAQPVALSDVAATAHTVAGVSAVDIDRLYRESGPQSSVTDHNLLESRTARTVVPAGLQPAEILTLSPAPFDWLEVMT